MSLNRHTKIRFTIHDDICCLKEVIVENPFSNAEKWQVVANSIRQSSGKFFTRRSVRDHVFYLLRLFKSEDCSVLRKSGTEEQYKEREQLLETIVLLDNESASSVKPPASSRSTRSVARNNVLDSMPEMKIEQYVEGTSELLDINWQMEEQNTSSSQDGSNSGVKETEQSATKTRADTSSKNIDNVGLKYLKDKLEADFRLRAEELQQSNKKLCLEEKRLALERDKFELESEERLTRLKMEEDEHKQKLQLEMEEKRQQLTNSQLQSEMFKILLTKFQD